MQKVFAGIQNLKTYDKSKAQHKINYNKRENHLSTLEERIKTRQMTLKDIYEVFWQDIDENNREFREYILKDPRRKRNT